MLRGSVFRDIARHADAAPSATGDLPVVHPGCQADLEVGWCREKVQVQQRHSRLPGVQVYDRLWPVKFEACVVAGADIGEAFGRRGCGHLR